MSNPPPPRNPKRSCNTAKGPGTLSWDLRPSCQVGFTNCMQTLILGLYNALYNVQPCVQRDNILLSHPSVQCTTVCTTTDMYVTHVCIVQRDTIRVCTSPICALYENTIHIYVYVTHLWIVRKHNTHIYVYVTHLWR